MTDLDTAIRERDRKFSEIVAEELKGMEDTFDAYNYAGEAPKDLRAEVNGAIVLAGRIERRIAALTGEGETEK